MKKIFSIIIATVIALTLIPNVYAVDSVSFVCSNAESEVHRLVTIDVKANCNNKLCAATFKFTYDNSMLEYRSVKTSDDDSSVTVNANKSSATMLYLNANGKNVKDNQVIFSITFKAVKNGTSYVDFSVYDCVDDYVNNISVGECSSAKITIGNGNNNFNNNNKSDTNKKSSSDTTDSISSGKSKRDNSEETTMYSATFEQIGLLNPLNDNNYFFIIFGIIGTCVLAFMVFAAFRIGRSSTKKKDDTNGTSD